MVRQKKQTIKIYGQKRLIEDPEATKTKYIKQTETTETIHKRKI